MKKSIIINLGIASIMLVLGLLAGKFLLGSHDNSTTVAVDHSENSEVNEDQVWTCSMHPQIRQNEPGDCPICGMDLVPVSEGGATGENSFEMSEAAIQLSNIQTSMVMRGNSERSIRLQGKVKQDERSISLVTARFAGRLDKLEVNFTGAEVKKGERLASIYSPQLVTAQRELLEALKVKNTTPQIYEAAKNKLKLWNLSEAQIQAIEQGGQPKEHIDITSPISGIVTQRMATLGEYVKEGSVLFHVTDLSKVWVMFDAYEGDLPFIKKNAPISFEVSSVPGKTFKSLVRFVDPVLDPKTRTASVRVELSNPNWELKPEMFANGTITVAPIGKDELMVPRSAVMWTGKRSVVYVKVPETEVPTFEFREVTLGSELNGNYEILSGLEEGEEVVTNGTFKVDASAQLAGKKSMMNRTGKAAPTGHDHGKMTSMSSEEKPNLSEAKFTVYGNCEMCQKRIENAATAVAGVQHATWDKDTKIFTAHFDKTKTDKTALSKAIAKVGHDTEFDKAEEKTYNNLAGCCQYDRSNK